MDSELRRLALRIKMHNVSGNVVHHAALLKKHLDHQGIKSEMVKGFCVIPETKEACGHYWIRELNSGLDLDVGFEVAKLRSPELQALHPVLLESIPPGMTRSDEKETMIREDNERLFELYQRDPKAFWREAPRDVTSFRTTN
jgi:hypothetical protein